MTKHTDKFGRSLEVDDFVVYSGYQLQIGQIVKLNEKMIKIIKVPAGRSNNKTVYSSDTLKVDPSDVTMYLLKHSK